jgi:type II secretory pathway predicted ATPase ExeA
MWQRHWGLNRDPFAEVDALYVPTPTHAEAVARLAHVIDAGQRSASLRAPGGLGKSFVLRQALAQARRRNCRVALVNSPTSSTSLLADLAALLAHERPMNTSRAQAWSRLADAVRLCFLQGQSVVLAVDDCDRLPDARDQLELARLVHVLPSSQGRLTVIQVSRELSSTAAHRTEWELAIRLAPLTRSEAEEFVRTKLRAAGRDEPAFAPAALTSLHALSSGVPRGIDRLASLCLMAGAWRDLAIISPEVVEAAALEFVPNGPEAALSRMH